VASKQLGAAAPAARTGSSWLNKDYVWAFLLLIPLLIGIALIYFSSIFGLIVSFTNWDIVQKAEWVGLQNYQDVAADEKVWKSLGNTLLFIVYSVPAKIILGLALAMLLNLKLKGVNFFKLLYFFPTACSIIAVALVWGYLYDSNGLLNNFLNDLGLSKVYWLDEYHAMGSVAIMSIWGGVGYNALLFLAGLQNIPIEYYEAGRVDGATRFQQFRLITIPLLTPTMFFVIVTLMIGSFQMFGEVYIIHGPLDSTLTIVPYIFSEAFQGFRMGYASALSYLLIVIILLITLLQLKLQKKWVNYDL